MLEKAVGNAVCSHCQMRPADRSCERCGHLVCPECSSAWASCRQPSTLILDLETGPLRDVDPSGLIGLVGRESLKLVNLRTRRPIDLPIESHVACLAAGPRLVTPVEGNDEKCPGLRIQQLWLGGESYGLATAVVRHTPRALVASADGRLVALHNRIPELEIIDPIRVVSVAGTSAPRQHGDCVCAVSSASDLLAVGRFGRVDLYRCGSFEVVYKEALPHPRQPVWLGIGARYFVLIDDAGIVAVHELAIKDGAVHVARRVRDVGFALAAAANLRAASISPDGQHLVISTNDQTMLLRADRGQGRVLAEHEAKVTFARFVANGKLLITADESGRVVVRSVCDDAGDAQIARRRPGGRAPQIGHGVSMHSGPPAERRKVIARHEVPDARGDPLPDRTANADTSPCRAGSVAAMFDAAAEDVDLGDRELCSDGNCIGVIGTDGRCKECGRPGK